MFNMEDILAAGVIGFGIGALVVLLCFWRGYSVIVKRIDTMGRCSYNVHYLCDGKACEGCKDGANPDCTHTTDIRHAANFEFVATDLYAEKVDDAEVVPDEV